MQRFAVKKSLIETMRIMSVGDRISVKNGEFRIYSARNAASKLKKEGYSFDVTEKGNPDGFTIIRIN